MSSFPTFPTISHSTPRQILRRVTQHNVKQSSRQLFPWEKLPYYFIVSTAENLPSHNIRFLSRRAREEKRINRVRGGRGSRSPLFSARSLSRKARANKAAGYLADIGHKSSASYFHCHIANALGTIDAGSHVSARGNKRATMLYANAGKCRCRNPRKRHKLRIECPDVYIHIYRARNRDLASRNFGAVFGNE